MQSFEKILEKTLKMKDITKIVAFSISIFGILVALNYDHFKSGLVVTILFIVLFICYLQLKLIQSNKQKYSFIRGSSGRELQKAIKKAKKTITVTCFSQDKPTDEYIELMLNKLKEGVLITRIVLRDDKGMDKPSWLKKFKDNKHYIEKTSTHGGLPFDVYIFDDSTTRIYFPDSIEHEHFKSGLKFIDPEVSKMFKTALYKVSS